MKTSLRQYLSVSSCFKDYFIHKFRAVLVKNRVIFPQEKVLLAVSGGAASCSMLSQVQEVFNLPTSALVPGPSDPDPSNPSYKQAVDQYIKEKQTLTEESVASAVAQLSIEDSAYLPEHKLALERLFSSLKTLTAKEDML